MRGRLPPTECSIHNEASTDMHHDYDAVIVGAGPAGSTTALYAARHGLRVLLVDKAEFPRDKICGDAISGRSIEYLEDLDLLSSVESGPHARIEAVAFSSPNGAYARISMNPNGRGSAFFYAARRQVFDDILFQSAKKEVETLEGFRVDEVRRTADGRVAGVTGRFRDGSERTITSRWVVGADGFSSAVLRKTGLFDNDPDHWIVATRAYYRGVPIRRDTIEIHYLEDIQLGYFWIFPLEEDLVNVGVGMVHSALKEKGVPLRDVHQQAVSSAFLRDRFQGAVPQTGIVGWNLPVGSKRRPVRGPGFLLVGDAAGLIDPFFGEGIGNAMCSGKIAAEVLAEGRTDVGLDVGASYESRLHAALEGELRLSYRLQRISRFRPLINLIVSKAAGSKEVADWVSGMMTGSVPIKQLANPMAYGRLLFK